MKIGKPNIHLIKKTYVDAPNIYYLHSITYFYRTNLEAAGHAPISTELDDEGRVTVVLRVRENPDVPEFRCITPIVHTVEIGALPFEDEIGLIRVVVRGGGKDPAESGENTTSSAAADEDEKPIGTH